MNSSISVILKKYESKSRDSLIPILQEVQETEGYLSKDALVEIGKDLNLPVSKIYGVATFYNQFRFQPKGKYHILVCRGTACHVKGSEKLLETICRNLDLKPGMTTKDRMFSIDTVACLGACGLSPVICINGEFVAKVTPKKALKILDELKEKESENARV
ncbi:MAG TPA: NADH-quinone oxidoreductase subunit NuoE [Lentisphaeria bacterium]|nr:MAG: NADH dehydrogenase [Lentisphaerae bacterium GWF2_38_69]HBM17365.1 NADH-quinone oxidoreductase subunit NuoE [Lentisphaeria bacterium]